MVNVLGVGGILNEVRYRSAGGSVDAVFDELISLLGGLPANDLIATSVRFEQRLSALRLAAAAEMVGGTGDVARDRRNARTALRVPGTSVRSVATDARRAAAVANNDALAGQLVSGAIAPASIDGLNRAADPETGSIPSELVNAVAGLNPDETRRMVDVYLEDHVDDEAVEDLDRAQHEHRRVRRYRVPAEAGCPELAGLGIEGPEVEIERMMAELDAAANGMYVDDGGRQRPARTHRSFDQRRFDAAKSFFGFGEGVKPAPAAGRPSVVVTIDAADLGTSEGKAQLVGGGPIADRALNELLVDCDIATLILGADRVPLWMGRVRRHASRYQFLALAVRDRGCVLCSAPVNRCDAHHVIPWTAPARGRTDLNNMALLCQRCHRDLHHRTHTLYRARVAAGLVWRTRPAKPDEIPAKSPSPPQRE